jgi:hypothetical protein
MSKVDILKNLNRKNQIRESSIDNHYKGLFIDVVKKMKSSGFTLSEKDIGYTEQDAETFLMSQSGAQFLKNKGKILSTFGLAGTLTLGHTELSRAIHQVVGMEYHATKLAGVINPSYIDIAYNYMGSAESYSTLMLGAVGAGIIGASMFTKKISDRNTIEEGIANKFDNSELRKALQEHKETESFRLGLSVTNKYLSKFIENSQNTMDLIVLSMHKYKKGVICGGLKAFFGEENFKDLRRETKAQYQEILKTISERKESRKGDLLTNSFREMFENISENAENIQAGLKTNRELDIKIKGIYKKITKDTYEEFLVKGVRDVALQSISMIVYNARELDKNYNNLELRDEIVKELRILQEIKVLDRKTSNDDVNKYTIISKVAENFLNLYENNYDLIKDKNPNTLYKELISSNFDEISNSKEGQEYTLNQLMVTFNDTIDESSQSFISVLKRRVDNFIDDHNALELSKQQKAEERALKNVSVKNFLNTKGIVSDNKKVVGIKVLK